MVDLGLVSRRQTTSRLCPCSRRLPGNFTAEHINEALAPIILFHQIGAFNGFEEVNTRVTGGLEHTPLEASSSSYGTETWFAYIQELDEAETRVILDK